MQVVNVKVSDLTPYARNSRTHSDAQISQIAASIQAFGFTNPILVNGSNTIIAGHGRLLAAQKLGIDVVPVIILDYLSAEQQKALVIADNQIALNAGWDMDMLENEMRILDDDGYDLSIVGFSDADLEKMLADIGEVGLPELADGDKEPFQKITFTLHDAQAEQVKVAIAAAKAMGAFIDTFNENSNGNALARICETFLTGAANAQC